MIIGFKNYLPVKALSIDDALKIVKSTFVENTIKFYGIF